MRLEKARFHKYGPFDDFELDLTGLGDDAKLVAVCGRNGAGKTCALESSILGACFRSMATQGTLIGRARARDSFVESRLVNGHAYTIRHDLDAVARKGEAVVLVDGSPAYKGTSVRAFDKWAAQHLPTEDVLRSTIFAVQGSGGFLQLSSAERISVILRACGVERIERMAAIARAHLGEVRLALDLLATRIADARGGAPVLDGAEARLAQDRELATKAEERLATARAALEAAQAEDKRLAEARQVAGAARARRAEKLTALDAARAAVPDLEERIANNRKVLAEAEAIRSAVAEVERLTAEIATGKVAASQAETDARREADTVATCLDRLHRLTVKIERAGEVLASRAAIDSAVASLPALEVSATEAAGAVGVAEDALEDLRGKHVAGADERIKGLRTGYEKIVEWTRAPGADSTECADNALDEAEQRLTEDDQAVALASELPGQVGQAQAALKAARERKEAADRKLAEARRVGARAELLAAAEREHDVAKSEHAQVGREGDDAKTSQLAATGAAKTRRETLALNEAALARAKPTADKAEHLARAEVRLTELEPQLVAAREAVSKAETDLVGAPEPAAVADGPALAPLDRAARDAETDARAAAAAVTRSEGALEQARAVGERVAALELERAAAEQDLADWNRLALDLGRDGIQSAEVDSAGPELTELANDLLHTCHGPQYTLSVDTQRASADGKSMIDDCSVMVLDTVAGREDEARNFSGGEKVILAEAVSLALTMLSCRRQGIERPTLVRDESAAALDAVNARVWIAMLRRAVEIVGADRLLFVSHSREVQEMADARIEVGGG